MDNEELILSFLRNPWGWENTRYHNLKHRDTFLYSYEMPIGSAHKGNTVFLVKDNSASGVTNTTNRHISLLKSSISSAHITIQCGYPTGSHAENFRYWQSELTSLEASLKKARKPEKYLTKKKFLLDNLEEYKKLFKIKSPVYIQKLTGEWEIEQQVIRKEKEKTALAVIKALKNWGAIKSV